MRNIRSADLKEGDVLVAADPDDMDTFMLLDGADPMMWDVLVLSSDGWRAALASSQLYAPGRVVRSWIGRRATLAGDYDVYRGGSLLKKLR